MFRLQASISTQSRKFRLSSLSFSPLFKGRDRLFLQRLLGLKGALRFSYHLAFLQESSAGSVTWSSVMCTWHILLLLMNLKIPLLKSVPTSLKKIPSKRTSFESVKLTRKNPNISIVGKNSLKNLK